MATATDFTRIALALPGTIAAPHVDRTAFKVKRIYATLAPERTSANIKFTIDEQMFKCQLAPDVFAALDNGWGRQGWTRLSLATATLDDIAAALQLAHAHALP